MRDAFDVSLEEYLYFGGFPGAAPLVGEPMRWRRYVLDAFAAAFRPDRTLLIGGDGIALGDFLSRPVEHGLDR
jgi:hypothetical protein